MFKKIISLSLVLSFILTLLTVLPLPSSALQAQDGLKVLYNRGFEEGWGYDNGLSNESINQVDASITYERMSITWYNYSLRIEPKGDGGGYLKMPLADYTPTSGKLFFEFDLTASSDNNIGGIIMMADMASEPTLSHIVALTDGDIYVLGENLGKAPQSTVTISFVFNYDYSSGDEYQITASLSDGRSASRVYSADRFGLASLYFGAQENFLELDRAGDYYLLDNVKLYYGVDEPSRLEPSDYGKLVDKSFPKTITVLGYAGADEDVLSGAPAFERNDLDFSKDKIYYSRHFSDGWNFDIGFVDFSSNDTRRGNSFSIAEDYDKDINKDPTKPSNYYMQYALRSSEYGFICFETSSHVARTGKCYLEFDIKASERATISSMLQILTPGAPIVYTDTLSLQNGNLYAFGTELGLLGDKWAHLVFEMDFDYGPSIGDPTAIKYTIWIGDDGNSASTIVHLDPAAADKTAFRGLREVRIGGKSTQLDGSVWYGIDNLQLYSSSAPANITFEDNGTLIDPNATKDFVIDTGEADISSPAAILETSLSMKVNSNNALLRGQKVAFFTDKDGKAYGGPYKENEKIMVPVQPLLDYTGAIYRFHSGDIACEMQLGEIYSTFSYGSDLAQIDGKTIRLSAAPFLKSFGDDSVLYLCLDDVEKIFSGYYVTYDDVGFISISTVDNYIGREYQSDLMREAMKRFVLDELKADEVYDLARENTNNFDHPYFYATQDRYDYLYDVYHSENGDDIYDPDLYRYIDDVVLYANTYMEKYANLDENGKYLSVKDGQWVYSSIGMASWVTTLETGNHSVSIAPYPDSGGYDPAGGRLNVLSDGETCLSIACEATAFAYQMTRDESYARFAYDFAAALCSWPHWGPGHYLNVGTTARNIGMAYDMLYDIWNELGYDTSVIRDGLHRVCTYTAWRTLNGLAPEYGRPGRSDGSRYWSHKGNWNPVCSSGVLVCAFLSLEDPDHAEMGAEVAAKTVYYLGINGFDYFEFDGAYREASGYWCATIRFSQYCILTVENTLGYDYGLSKSAGLDKTNYFGSHVQSNDYVSWNFHDDYVNNLPSFWYYIAADMFDNPEFAAMRYQHIQNGKGTYRWDALFYDKATIEKGNVSLSLDHTMESIGAFTSRASWEPGDLYVGIMGGYNNCAHGQFDSGNWIYENCGVRWFYDLGSDDYNLYGGGMTGGPLGGAYYKNSTEGNNVVGIASLPNIMPSGQTYTGGGRLVYTFSNEYGSASIIDQSLAYNGSSVVTYARRGMLLTNDRKTVVIQDEINLVLAQDLYWFAHYTSSEVARVELSDDSKTAFMTSVPDENGKTHTLRVSLLTANRGLKFEIQDAYTTIMPGTPDKNYSSDKNGIAEQNRDAFNKLVIKAEGVLKFEVAVVLEIIDPDNPIELGYKQGWQGNKAAIPPMSSWVPTEDARDHKDVTEELNLRGNPTLYSILLNSQAISSLISSGEMHSVYSDLFIALTDVEYSLQYFGREQNNPDILAAISVYDEVREKYDRFRDKAAYDTEKVGEISKGLIGIN